MNIRCVVLAILLALPLLADDESVTAPAVMTGQIVDLHCYTSRGAAGEEHAGCANACISRNVPAGFLADDGTLYLLLDEKSVSVKDKVAGKAGKPVKVTGKVIERSGLKALQLVSVE